MRRSVQSLFLSALLAVPLAIPPVSPVAAQPVEFDPADFGKIVVARRQSAGTGLVLEQAFGDYQNEPVIAYGENSIARRLGRPVGRLDVLYKNGKTGYCTAFIVDTEHLVTNNHCIPGVDDVGVQAAQFVAGYVDAAHPDKAEKFQVALEPLETSAALDFSVLRVFGDPSARYGKVLLADADPESSEFLWIIGHPQGQAQHISREGCAAGDPPVSTEGKVVHTCDTLGGNSGSPVFRISDRQVVALHHAGDNRTGFNFAIPMTRILSESRILKAAATPEPPEGQGACQSLWEAAGAHGCTGYRAYLDSCPGHALRPLAERLMAQSCSPGVADDRTELVAAILAAEAAAGTEIEAAQALIEEMLEILKAGNAAHFDTFQGHFDGTSQAASKVYLLWGAWLERADTEIGRAIDVEEQLDRLQVVLHSAAAGVDAGQTREALVARRDEAEALRREVSDLSGRVTEIRANLMSDYDAVRTRAAALITQEPDPTASETERLREQHAARPAIVTRCLELGAPQFSVEGIQGVATSDLDEGAAFEVCSEAIRVSDEPAARYALARAQYEMGNQGAATAVFRTLADEGFIPAMYHLGTAHNSGNGVPRDYAKALKIFEETVAAGLPQGKFSLGVYYSLGRAVRTDHTRAGQLLAESIADGYDHPITQLHKLPGATIRAVQRDLVSRGYLSAGQVDGAFGPTTRSALERLAAAASR